jgi:hypothetical protein
VALESSLYGQTAFSQADLEEEWSELDLEQDARGLWSRRSRVRVPSLTLPAANRRTPASSAQGRAKRCPRALFARSYRTAPATVTTPPRSLDAEIPAARFRASGCAEIRISTVREVAAMVSIALS